MKQPRRMPADATGRGGFCTPGGIIAAYADEMEEHILEMTEKDLSRVEELLTLPGLDKSELILALGYLHQSAKACVDTARCRGERLEEYADRAEEVEEVEASTA